jgi:hypothetical protein
VKRAAFIAGGGLALVIVALVNGLRATGHAEVAGFLGPGSLLADINLSLEILLVLGLTLGFAFARGGRIEAHRVSQSVCVLVNAALVLCIMIPSLRNAKLSGPADLAKVATGLPWLHAAIGALTLVGGLWLVLQMNDVLPRSWHIRGWKTLMRLTFAGYWMVALLGIGIYFFWNVG